MLAIHRRQKHSSRKYGEVGRQTQSHHNSLSVQASALYFMSKAIYHARATVADRATAQSRPIDTKG